MGAAGSPLGKILKTEIKIGVTVQKQKFGPFRKGRSTRELKEWIPA
jgi:hypothetical protein